MIGVVEHHQVEWHLLRAEYRLQGRAAQRHDLLMVTGQHMGVTEVGPVPAIFRVPGQVGLHFWDQPGAILLGKEPVRPVLDVRIQRPGLGKPFLGRFLLVERKETGCDRLVGPP